MKFKTIVMIILVNFFVFGCDNKSDVEMQIEERLDSIYSANPSMDFDQAVLRKDFRFIGLNGVGLYVPEVSKCLIEQFGVNTIEGTSDALENYQHSQFQALAKVYATDYNVRMMIYISNNKLSKCQG